MLYDFECQCGKKVEKIVRKPDDSVFCTECGKEMKKLFPTRTSFQLKYDPRKDKVDWSGNTTRRYEEVNKRRK